MKKPNKPGEYASSPKDIAINTSSYNNVESPSDVSDFTLFDAVLRPSTVNNYVNFSKNPSNYLIYNSENGALIRNNRCEVVICSKNSLIFQADTDVSYVDIYQPTEIIYIETGSGMYINTFSDWSIQVNSAYNVELSAITDWSDKFIKLVSRNLYIKVKGYNSATYTLNVEFSTNGMLTSPDDIGATDGIITLVSKTKDLNSIFWKNVPVNKTSSFAIQLSSEDIDGNGTSIQFYDNTDWSNYSDWYSASLKIFVGGWRVGSYNLVTKEYTHISDRPIGDVHLLFDFDKSGGTGDGGTVSADNLSITFNNNDKIYLNKMSIGAQDGSAWELYSDEYYNLYYNSSRSNICTINDLKEKCYYPTKAFYDIVYYSSIYSEDPVLILEDIYSYTKNNLLIKDNGSNKLQLSNENNINDDAVFDEILTKQLPIINDYTSLGAIDSDFKFYTANTFEESVGDMSLSSTNIDSFSINSTVLDYKYYYIQFTPTGHIWKVHNRLSTLYLNNDNILSSFIQIKDLNGDTFLIRDSDGTEMSLSEAVKGKMVRKFKLEIDQDWNAAGEENALEIKNNGSDIFRVDKSGNIFASGDIYFDGQSNLEYIDLPQKLNPLSNSYYDNKDEKTFSRLIPKGLAGSTDEVWAIMDSLIVGNLYGSSFVIDDYGYYLEADNNTKLNPNTETWSRVGSIPTVDPCLAIYAAFSINGYGYICGGEGDYGYGDYCMKYNSSSDSWISVEDVPYEDAYMCGFNLNNFGYIGGGTEDQYRTGKYNDLLDSWVVVADSTYSKESDGIFSIDGYGYSTGDDVERYNDIANVWVSISSSSYITNGGSSAIGVRGIGYSAGGDAGSTWSNYVERYSPQLDTWTAVASMNEERVVSTGFSIKMHGYVCGGENASGEVNYVDKMSSGYNYFYLGKLYTSNTAPTKIFAGHSYDYTLYDIDNNKRKDYLDHLPIQIKTCSGDSQWISMETNEAYTDMSMFSGDTYNSKYNYEVNVGIPHYHDISNYAPSGLNIWTTIDSMTYSRSESIVFNINEYTYVAGGYGSGSRVTYVERFTPIIDSWTTLDPLSTSRAGAGCSAVNNYGYAIGGITGASSTPSDSVLKYDPITDTWTLNTSGVSEFNAYSFGASIGDYIYIPGGYTGTIETLKTVRYDTVSETGGEHSSMVYDRGYLGGFVLNEQIFAPGGYDSPSNISSVERYNVLAGTWSTVDSLNSATGRHIGFSLNNYGYVVRDSGEKYNYEINSWSMNLDSSTISYDSESTVAGDSAYSIGGSASAGGNGVDTVKKYVGDSIIRPILKGVAIKIIE